MEARGLDHWAARAVPDSYFRDGKTEHREVKRFAKVYTSGGWWSGVHRAAVTTLSSLRGELVPETDEGIHIHVRLAICGGKWKAGPLLDVQLGRKQHEENEADQPQTHADSGKTAVGVPSE